MTRGATAALGAPARLPPIVTVRGAVDDLADEDAVLGVISEVDGVADVVSEIDVVAVEEADRGPAAG